MKRKHMVTILGSFLFILLALPLAILAQGKKPHIVSYVTSWTKPVPDPNLISHINYAFGHVNDTFNGVKIDNPDRLREIVKLRKNHPDLKILLSIGGWTSGRFSEMAADETNRLGFAKDCQKIVKEFDLDGIDIDWEYPTSNEAGISASPEDTDNFTLLMRDIRKEIGPKKLLTLATIADGKYIDFRAIDKDIDFVNVMMYDVSKPPLQHNSLYRSDLAGRITLVEALQAHLDAGVPKNKLVMGIPFYGRGDKKKVNDFVNFREMPMSQFEERWDDKSKVPYLVDDSGVLVLTFENEKSIKEKAAYIKSQGILGAMYWEFYGDNDDLLLSKTLYDGLK
ncbi:glycoside hydrolase family 18 protein [Sphingobacterium daejeonense]|uniref:glycoside hydrolase family 18 protein n=1 Tax=Sphingobacterium daejeonense TaxID=371142 RepID=UPI0010C40F76|nr:glycosyl hydrolase family 18 protein [Sphingobacterium daejeonense]VTP90631.1 Chitinase A1 precursor [Sphingobacterium daejeonense]